MTACMQCDSTAAIERVTVLESTDGPVLLTRWRCQADFHHWWDGVTDASPRAVTGTESQGDRQQTCGIPQRRARRAEALPGGREGPRLDRRIPPR